MTAFLAYAFYIASSLALIVLTMIYGWGLEPKSWWWIIGVGFCVRILWDAVGSKLQKEVFGGKD